MENSPIGPHPVMATTFGGDLARQHGVHRVAQRVEDGRVLLGDRRVELPDVGLGNDDVLGEGAVGVDADDLHVLADVRLADTALQALAARDVHFSGDEVAFLDAGHFVADGLDRAAEFVTGNQGRMNAALRPLVPLINMQIGAADGRRLDFDQHIGRAILRYRNFADFCARRGRGLNNSKHSIRHEDGSWARLPMFAKSQRKHGGTHVSPVRLKSGGQTSNFNTAKAGDQWTGCDRGCPKFHRKMSVTATAKMATSAKPSADLY